MPQDEGVAPTARLRAVDFDRLQRPASATWKPWFPVIDYSRCTNCMQCLSFCLFDVYGVSPDRKIQVQNQNNCKTDCPACSRVCPEVAIMFPEVSPRPDQRRRGAGRRRAPRGDEGGHLGAARRRHLLDAARPQREGEVALLEGARRRARAEGAAELPGDTEARSRHPGGSAGGAAVAGRDPRQGRSGAAARRSARAAAAPTDRKA